MEIWKLHFGKKIEDKMLMKKYQKGTICLRSKASLDRVKKISYKLGKVREMVAQVLHVEAYGPNSNKAP